MKPTKHVGKVKNTGSKCLVVFRTLPGEANMALIVETATLPDSYHNAIIDLVDSDQAQDAFEFGEMLFVRPFPDGRPMLRALQADGRLKKVATDNVVMTPTPNREVSLAQLNVLIAEQKNCTIDDLCTFVKGGPNDPGLVDSQKRKTETVVQPQIQAAENQVLTDTDLAKSYRSQADAMYKEAARLRKQADELDPPKKKTTTKTADAEETV
jgi:hypothetical protein